MRRYILILLSVILFPVLLTAEEKKSNLRGVERESYSLMDPLRSAGTAALYPLNALTNSGLYGAGKAAAVLTDKDFIKKVKDILYLYKRELMWFPLASYASGFRPEYGVGLYYTPSSTKHLFQAMMHDADYWSLSLKNSYEHYFDRARVKASLIGLMERKDDFQYYGLGPDPKNDHRNSFIASNDYGTFSEERKRLGWETAVYPREFWGMSYRAFFERKSYDPDGRGNDDLRDIMDVSTIPGFSTPHTQIYNEAAVHIDTRDEKKMLSPGVKGEVYSGISAGLRDNHSELFRTGFDAAAFIPTNKEDRLIVPRTVFDLVENLDDEAIPFSEYPKHPTFRGTASREWIRSERVSMVPSLEYQWPLSHLFSGHLFFDTLFTGPSVSSIRWHEGLWAAGGGIDFHLLKQQWGRFDIAGGSEGLQVTISFAVPLRINRR